MQNVSNKLFILIVKVKLRKKKKYLYILFKYKLSISHNKVMARDSAASVEGRDAHESKLLGLKSLLK